MCMTPMPKITGEAGGLATAEKKKRQYLSAVQFQEWTLKLQSHSTPGMGSDEGEALR